MIAGITACSDDDATLASDAAVARSESTACIPDGRLRVTLFAAEEVQIQWRTPALQCTGMPRPDDDGARLRFAGSVPDADTTLAFILGVPKLARGATGVELPTNVTVMEEGSGRFYSTPDEDNCWTDVASQEPLSGNDAVYVIKGVVYCVAPIAEVNGSSEVSFHELSFTGRIDWEPPQ